MTRFVRRQRIAPAIVVVAAVCAAAACSSSIVAGVEAARYEPELWNSYINATASNVPEGLLFLAPPQQKLFPIEGSGDVKAACNSPSRPFPNARAATAPDACWYAPEEESGGQAAGGGSGGGSGGDSKQAATYSFWQKLPGARLRQSNCYCYAVDRFEGAWCFPGLGAGLGDPDDPSQLSCATLTTRVEADGAAPAKRADAVYGPAVPPKGGGHYIALMFRPLASCHFARCEPDFHVLRRDESGLWSHKAGEAPATDRDAAGAVITDPEAARIDGDYTEFCGYFRVDPATAKIGARRGPDRVDAALARWRAAGVKPEVAPLPYEAATDGAAPAEAARAREVSEARQLQRGGTARRALALR